jgi:hypothetical protein
MISYKRWRIECKSCTQCQRGSLLLNRTGSQIRTEARYVVLWDLQWRWFDCRRLEPAADLSAAMEVTIGRLEAEGWQTEATPEYGFAFIRRVPIVDC